MPRFERGVPGSTPGRGTDSPVVEWPRRLPDTEEIGGSIPPGTTGQTRDTRHETEASRVFLVSRVSCLVSLFGWATRPGDGPRLERERAARPCGFDSHPLRCVCGVTALHTRL